MADAVERFRAEVGGAEAREVGAPEDRAAAYGIVEKRFYRGVRVVDGVVGGRAADVRVGVVGGLAGDFPVGAERRRGLGADPVALFEAGHFQTGRGEFPGGGGTGGAGTDDEDVIHEAGSRWRPESGAKCWLTWEKGARYHVGIASVSRRCRCQKQGDERDARG